MAVKNFLQSKNNIFSVFKYSWSAILLVWQTSRSLTLTLGILNLVSGVLPAVMAYVGKLIIDSVVQAIQSGTVTDQNTALYYLLVEAVIVILLTAARQGISVCESLLRAMLGHKVNTLILEKALSLT